MSYPEETFIKYKVLAEACDGTVNLVGLVPPSANEKGRKTGGD